MLTDEQILFLHKELYNEKFGDIPTIVDRIERYIDINILSLTLTQWAELDQYIRGMMSGIEKKLGTGDRDLQEKYHKLFCIADSIETYPLMQEVDIAEGDVDIGALFED